VTLLCKKGDEKAESEEFDVARANAHRYSQPQSPRRHSHADGEKEEHHHHKSPPIHKVDIDASMYSF
jgi:hypothetical protein